MNWIGENAMIVGVVTSGSTERISTQAESLCEEGSIPANSHEHAVVFAAGQTAWLGDQAALLIRHHPKSDSNSSVAGPLLEF